MKLDVGCGTFLEATGDVNVDLFTEKTLHRPSDSTIDVHKIRNFVLAESAHLPFADNTFEEVYASHIIEHVDNPTAHLMEWLRVSNHKLTIKTPFRNGKLNFISWILHGPPPKHIHKWNFNKKWFIRFVQKYGLGIRGLYTKHFLLVLPTEITIEIIKPESD